MLVVGVLCQLTWFELWTSHSNSSGVPVKPLELRFGTLFFKKVKAVTGNESKENHLFNYLTIKKEEGMSAGPEKCRRYSYWLCITYQ
jgi:hypothetical protein